MWVFLSPLLDLHGEEGALFMLAHVRVREDLVAVLFVGLVLHSVEDVTVKSA